MACDWDLIDDLCGGTRAMRAAGIKWLPQEEGESEKAYSVRLNRSFLYGGLKDTLRRLRSKPMSRDVTLHGTLPESISGIERNVDGEGQNLTQFASALFDDAAKRGLTHFLVSYPSLEKEGETPAQRKKRINAPVEAKIRPYFVHVKADAVLGWESEPDPVEGRRLTLVRIKECVSERDGEWGTKEIEQIRVLTPGRWEIYRQKGTQKTWLLHESGTTSMQRIPLVTCYFNRTGFMTAEPPLVDLAWLNVAHWCSSSDQNHILRFSRFGILFLKGETVKGKDGRETVLIGPSRLLRGKTDSDLKVVEGTGASIGAGRTDVLDIEARMEVMGLAPLMERTGDATATGRAMDESRSQSDIQAWIRSLEAALRTGFSYAAEWKKTDLASEFAVDIFNEFGISTRAAAEIEHLLRARLAKQITHARYLKEVQRRSVLGDDMNVEEEIDAVNNEVGSDGLTGTGDSSIGPAGGDGPGARTAA